MNDNKLLNILRTFNQVEFRRLNQYITCGYYTKDKHILHLAALLMENFPNLEGVVFERNRLYAAIYKEETLDMPKLRRLLSNFTLLVEDFLVTEKLDDKKAIKSGVLKQVYQQRALDNYYEHLLVLEEIDLKETPYRNAEHYYRQYRLHDEQYQFYSGKQNRSLQLQPQNVLDSLEVFYLVSKLRITCEIVNRGNILNTSPDGQMVQNLLQTTAHEKFAAVPPIAIYRQIILCLTEPEQEAHYQQLKDLLKDAQSIFEPNELRDVYALAQNYCIRKINTGRSEYLQELFELYKALLDNGLLTEGGHLSQFHYKNMVQVALRLKNFDWCHEFIENYAANLNPAEKTNAYTYNLAYYYFSKKDYNKSFKLLNRIEFTDVFYFLDSRALLLKTYYELDEIDPLLTLLDTFQSNLKRNKRISTLQKTIYLNLVKVVRKLVKLPPSNKAQREKLNAYVTNNHQIADRVWVLTKLGEL